MGILGLFGLRCLEFGVSGPGGAHGGSAGQAVRCKMQRPWTRGV